MFTEYRWRLIGGSVAIAVIFVIHNTIKDEKERKQEWKKFLVDLNTFAKEMETASDLESLSKLVQTYLLPHKAKILKRPYRYGPSNALFFKFYTLIALIDESLKPEWVSNQTLLDFQNSFREVIRQINSISSVLRLS